MREARTTRYFSSSVVLECYGTFTRAVIVHHVKKRITTNDMQGAGCPSLPGISPGNPIAFHLDMQELPATQYLGYGLNMTTDYIFPKKLEYTFTCLLKIQSSILRAYRLINLDPETAGITVGSTAYHTPKNVSVHDSPSVHSSYHAYSSGNAATSALERDASLAFSFLAVSLDVSDVIKEYKRFFATIGSHVITGITYGARFQMCISSSTNQSEVDSSFSAYVQTAFNGIVSAGSFDASIKETRQYQSFYAGMKKNVTIRGGNPQLAESLAHDPTNWDAFQLWSSTLLHRAEITNIQTQEIWNLMALDPNIAHAAESVRAAYMYIAAPPKHVHVTPVQFNVSSDWGTFTLLSPGALIEPDPDARGCCHGQVDIAEKAVGWNSGSKTPSIGSASFVIKNDGSPIHFHTSHGSGGGGPRQGLADVMMNGNTYTNHGITDDRWNTRWFYDCPVNPRYVQEIGDNAS
ncbi:hypothetical protein B0H14DRAFT_3581332 [Mycena olivaceomarginata]|nr:hypothetical protein B0H14DRAFT_3581332 [Mycena olivaceomarginata]